MKQKFKSKKLWIGLVLVLCLSLFGIKLIMNNTQQENLIAHVDTEPQNKEDAQDKESNFNESIETSEDSDNDKSDKTKNQTNDNALAENSEENQNEVVKSKAGDEKSPNKKNDSTNVATKNEKEAKKETKPKEQTKPVVKAETKPSASSKPVVKAETKPSASSKPVVKAETKPSASSKPVVKAETKPSASSKPVVKEEAKPSTSSKPVVTKKTITTTESIPFQTTTRETKELKEGESRVAQQGSNGLKSITFTITYSDGKEISRVKSGETVTVQPKDKIVENGSLRWVVTKPAWTEEFRQPVYVPTWWVTDWDKNQTYTYYSEIEAYNHYANGVGNLSWGTGEDVPDPSGKTVVYATKYHPEEGEWR